MGRGLFSVRRRCCARARVEVGCDQSRRGLRDGRAPNSGRRWKRLGASHMPGQRQCLLPLCPWRRGWNDSPVDGVERPRSRLARDRDIEVSISVHGETIETTGPAKDCSFGRARSRCRSHEADTEFAVVCGRQVVRRSHDLADASGVATTRGSRSRFPGLPLHPSGKPGIDRAEHLSRVQISMLFVSGARDSLAELDLLEPVVKDLGDRATLHVVADADHSLTVPAKSDRTSGDAEAEALDAMAEWMLRLS